MIRYLIILCLFISACGQEPTGEENHISTEEDRAALYDYIYQKTLEREAFSPVKEQKLGVDIKEEMKKVRGDIVNASSDEELYFAIKKMSCARKDRHLDIDQVEGGLQLDSLQGGAVQLRFLPDFSSEDIVLFVADYTGDIGEQLPKGTEVHTGDRVLEVNGKSLARYYRDAEPYIRYSTIPNLKMNFAELLSEKDEALLPPSFYQAKLELKLEGADGKVYELELPYKDPESLEFVRAQRDKYPGYSKAFERQTYHLYLPDDADNKSLLLWWYGFKEDLVGDMDHLVNYAKENGLLEHDLIIDLTDSRGGSKGAYVIQKICPDSFKTTFGNLKLSDMAADFVERREEAYARSEAFRDGAETETIDDGSWLINWLREDVVPRMEAGKEYSSNVPFKSAHAPHTSDGVLGPADDHFKGRLVCIFGPKGGSHLDQFSAMINDNDLGYTMGMPTGGYSNTWEGEEVLVFPISEQPVVEYMWSLGHTIRPNGEILEGNPAMVDTFIPLTRENYENYIPMLVKNAKQYLGYAN